ncbi:hypothetical protein [Tateyamaria sp. Alg231-49]|nr:hypothetical protein [Tateyamaria sp. Alg231-49]
MTNPAPPPTTLKLAAILAADVVSYSRMIGPNGGSPQSFGPIPRS